jgi:hypothetical protein
MNTWQLLALVATALTVGSAACGSDTPTRPSDTTTPVTETFSSIVPWKGATSRSFTTAATGTVTLSLTSLGQDAAVGLALGLADGANGQCAPTYWVVTTAYAGRQISANADAGRYCFLVYDVGELTGQVSFTVTVVHP